MSKKTNAEAAKTPVAVAVKEDDAGEPQDIIPTILDHCCEAIGLSGFDGTTAIANVLAGFILSNREAPEEAALMQVRRSLKAVIFPDEDPRKVRLAVRMFGMAILGLNDMQRDDDEAELRRMQQQEAAAAPVAKLREEERTMRSAGGGLHDLSDFGKAMSGKTA